MPSKQQANSCDSGDHPSHFHHTHHNITAPFAGGMKFATQISPLLNWILFFSKLCLYMLIYSNIKFNSCLYFVCPNFFFFFLVFLSVCVFYWHFFLGELFLFQILFVFILTNICFQSLFLVCFFSYLLNIVGLRYEKMQY